MLAAITRRGLTLRQLQDRSGVNRSTVGRWLAGRRTIRVRDCLAVLDALGMDIVVQERPRAELRLGDLAALRRRR